MDTIVVFDTHWLVNANYHVNCAEHFQGVYTSSELPHFISNLPFACPGNPGLGRLLARVCNEHGVETLAHDKTTLAAAAMAQLRPLLQIHHVGVTLQTDEGPEVFDAKNSSLHPLFPKA